MNFYAKVAYTVDVFGILEYIAAIGIRKLDTQLSKAALNFSWDSSLIRAANAENN